MKEQYPVVRHNKEEIVFTSGRTKAVKIAGIIVLVFGLWLIAAALAGWGNMPHGPIPVYLVGSICSVVGVGIISYRSKIRFDKARQHWQISTSLGQFRRKREGTFEELSEVVVDCDLALRGEADSAQGPYLYDVMVKLKDGSHINIRKRINHAHHAFSIANELCEKLSLDLKNNTGGKDNIIEVIPPDYAPEPSGRLSTSKFNGNKATFLIPSGTGLEKKYQISMGLTIVFVTVPLWGVSLFAAFVSWDWFDAWLKYEKMLDLRNALIAVVFIVVPLFLVYVIFSRIFMAREELQASPSGITYHRIYRRWSQKKRIARNQITAVRLRMNRFAPTPRMEDITIFTRSDAISVGQGLPDEEKIWIASNLHRILSMK